MPEVTTQKDAALARSHFGRELASAIDDAIFQAVPDDFEELSVFAHRLRLCNSNDNIWHATDLHNQHGEAFDGAGRFWHCGLKLCQYCVGKASRHNRKLLRHKIEEQKLNVGENLQMITLTMINKGLPLLEAREVFNIAWSLFRKKTWFKQTITGGCKSEEFTLTKLGYHYHAHVIARAKYIDWHKLRYFWTQAVEVAFHRRGLVFEVRNADGLLSVRADKITSIENAVKEVAKYITKNTTWSQIPKSDLLDVCRIRRFPRMFEFFGSFRSEVQYKPDQDDPDWFNKTILDTKELSDEQNTRGWREDVRQFGAATYLLDFRKRFHEQCGIRRDLLKAKYAAAKFFRVAPTGIDAFTEAELRLKKVASEYFRHTGVMPTGYNHFDRTGEFKGE